jgi:hypothetical protein
MDDRILPLFHLQGVEAGQQVLVFRIDSATGKRLGLLARATVGEGGWFCSHPMGRCPAEADPCSCRWR